MGRVLEEAEAWKLLQMKLRDRAASPEEEKRAGREEGLKAEEGRLCQGAGGWGAEAAEAGEDMTSTAAHHREAC